MKQGDGEYWYSNCLIEAIKAKLLYKKDIKLIVIAPWRNDVFIPHFMWYDKRDNLIKDFHAEPGFIEHWWEELFFKGHVRCRTLKAFNEWYKKSYGKEYINDGGRMQYQCYAGGGGMTREEAIEMLKSMREDEKNENRES